MNLIIRSYITGFSVHRMHSYKLADGSRKYLLQCHTRHHGDTKKGTEERCQWCAVLQYVEDEYARFVSINSFSLHSFKCFCHDSRMTPSEVSFRCSIPSSHLNGVMKKLRQEKVAKKALYMRNYRMSGATESLIDDDFANNLKDQHISETISNCEQVAVKPNDEVELIMRYLSYLKEHKQVEAYMTFAESDASTRMEVSSINMMWNEGKRLLTTHSDVLFCDSMWNVSFNGYFVLTIVVVDENYDIRLAALSIVRKERKDSWKSFYRFPCK